MGYFAKPIPSAGMAFAEEGGKHMANRNHYGRQMRRRMGIVSPPPPVKRRTSPPKPKVMMAAPTPTKRPLANLCKRIVNFFRRPTVAMP